MGWIIICAAMVFMMQVRQKEEEVVWCLGAS
jgi:hypothetical protein